jgi:hypothetical protein
MRKIAAMLIIISGSLKISAQERCAAVAYQKIQEENSKSNSREQFEQWIQQKTFNPRKTNATEKLNSSPTTIPVVVHIIHNGEPTGTGINISDAQIFSQIDVLNKDYQRLNTDASLTPAEFQLVAGMLNVQFVLAKQDPEGLPSTGIVRLKGTQTSWALADDVKLKSLSYWNADDYLNIWVTNIDDPNGFVGYAKFPISTLPDLSSSPNDPLTDGVVIHYDAFGSSDDGAFNLDPKFNKGRTTTHEVGHFFGLYHIWGDDNGSCSGTDYVADTPNQGNNYNAQCPVHPKVSCSTNDMFQNYMDYTNDNCMNIFTAGQVSRMTTVLQNSPRRASLTISKGATPPISVAVNLGIKSITSPGLTSCAGSNIPTILIRNYGTSLVVSAKIQLKLNLAIAETKDFTLNLSNLQETSLSFNAIAVVAGSTNQVSFEILQVNGQTDENINNNVKSVNFTVSQNTALPLLESFSSVLPGGAPAGWIIQNPDDLLTWQETSVPIDGVSNKAMSINLHSYEEEGAVDRLITPNMDFSNLTNALLKFDRAYAQFPGVTTDILRVLVSTDCAANLNDAIEIYNKSGSALATTASTSNFFMPSTQSQWAKETISLSPFLSQQNVQLIFEVKNGYGNNLFLDNVQILTEELVDLALIKINDPSPVICSLNPTPRVTVRNFGSKTITTFKVTSTAGGIVKSQTINNVSISPGDELAVTLNKLSLTSGANTVRFELSEPNSSIDARTDNDILQLNCIVNSATSGIPLRENFNINFESAWVTVSQGDQKKYGVANTNFSKSILYPGATNPVKGEEAWLVSPVLDFSRTSKASVFFDVSYNKLSQGNERLRVLSSSDCGVTFPTILFDQSGDSFSTTNSEAPKISSDWKNQFLYLDELVGEENARLAFIVTNDNGNNLYLDNIEFFIDDDSSPVKINSSYKVYPNENPSSFNITFNLTEKTNAGLQIYNLMGQIILENDLPETLNQTYTIDFSGQSSGIYIVRVKTTSEVSATKIFLTR